MSKAEGREIGEVQTGPEGPIMREAAIHLVRIAKGEIIYEFDKSYGDEIEIGQEPDRFIARVAIKQDGRINLMAQGTSTREEALDAAINAIHEAVPSDFGILIYVVKEDDFPPVLNRLASRPWLIVTLKAYKHIAHFVERYEGELFRELFPSAQTFRKTLAGLRQAGIKCAMTKATCELLPCNTDLLDHVD